MPRFRVCILGIGLLFVGFRAPAQGRSQEICPRPVAGSTVSEPKDLRSQNGVLKVELRYRNYGDAQGHMRYCYLANDASEAPNLRVSPGDWVILSLKNEIVATSMRDVMAMGPNDNPMLTGACASARMTPLSTNLHFHGLTVPPVCRQDDVLKTMIQPGDPPFEYRFQIPADEPPGLYWYHPHIHRFTSPQVLGGASGALIVEGIERANRELTGLPERVIVIRDQELLNPNAEPVKTDSVPPPIVLRDAEGDALNTGTGTGRPAKDLSINFVPVAYPDYRPAVIAAKPSERALWRVLNASAITYLDLQVLVNGAPQQMGVVSLDGTPINQNGVAGNRILWESHVMLPPAGRVEFIFKGVAEGAQASFVTRSVDTGPAGENDPTRPLATILPSDHAPEPSARLAASPTPLTTPSTVGLGNVKPARVRKLYFSEQPVDPANPDGPTAFFITVDGQEPAAFDPNSDVPNITVQQGDVEDWIIENRSRELHAFHIHQIHFMLIAIGMACRSMSRFCATRSMCSTGTGKALNKNIKDTKTGCFNSGTAA